MVRPSDPTPPRRPLPFLHPSHCATEEATMGAQVVQAGVDQATAERLSTALNRCFETYEAGRDVFAEDAFFDLRPPFWRFQLEGPEAFAAQLRAVAPGPTRARVLRAVPTATGFVMEHEETSDAEVAHRLFLCEVRDGRITEVTVYCNGGWDAELRARHAAEAPMLRPERDPK
jgi:hypothetical protein